jgi:hypothetical protein
MNLKKLSKYLAPVTLITLVSWAWQSAGWEGIVMAVTGFVTWVLLYFTNIVMVMRRARNNPVGYVASAVMFQSKLKEDMTHLNVIGYSRSLGERLSPKDEEPEVFLWKDNNDNRVTATFENGKLKSWEFKRPKLILPEDLAQDDRP